MNKSIIIRGLIYITIIILTTIISYTVFISSIGINTLSHSVNPYLSSYINLILPESFGFFTKSPKEENITLYNFKNGKLIEMDLRSNNQESLFGLSRKSRRLGYELGAAIRKIPQESWSMIDEIKLSKINFSKLQAFKIEKNVNILKLIKKGKYVLYYYEPVSWELNKIEKNTYGKFAYIEIY